MQYYWDERKNNKLKRERGITFERILVAIEQGDLIDILVHQNRSKYPGQKLLVINIDYYCWVVPFEDDTEQNRRKLITAFPSRKMTKHYLR